MSERFGERPSIPKQAPEAQPKSPEDFLEGIKRPYGVEDIRNLQEVIREFEERRVAEDATFVFGTSSFYNFLTSYHKGNPEGIDPEKIPTQEYAELELAVFNAWRNNLVTHKDLVLSRRPALADVIQALEILPAPQSLDELRNLYEKYPRINEMSSVQYQGGVKEGYLHSGFVHFNMSRAYGYTYELATKDEMRIYVNPPYTAIPQLSKKLIDRAAIAKLPLYFKTIDYSYQINPDNADRLDRMVIYTDKEHVPDLTAILEEIRTENPEWFKGRELPNLVAQVSEGIGVSAEPSEFQNQKFAGNGETRTSFNAVRAKFLEAVWKGVIQDVLIHNRSMRPRGGRTFEKIFNDQFESSAYDKGPKTATQLQEEQELLRKLWASNLSSEGLNMTNSYRLENTLMRVLQHILPNIAAESLMTYVNKNIQQRAVEFGVDPENIALNK